MSGAHLYNRVDLEDGLMVTIKPVTVKSATRYLLTADNLKLRTKSTYIFSTFSDAHAYAESCFNNEETPS